jgi:hypothetical protein
MLSCFHCTSIWLRQTHFTRLCNQTRKSGENLTAVAFHGDAYIITTGVPHKLSSKKTLAGVTGEFDQTWNPASCQFFFVFDR